MGLGIGFPIISCGISWLLSLPLPATSSPFEPALSSSWSMQQGHMAGFIKTMHGGMMTDPQTYFFRLAPHSQPTTSRTIYYLVPYNTLQVLTLLKCWHASRNLRRSPQRI